MNPDDRNAENLRELMTRLGIDPAGGVLARPALTYLTALHRCQSCPSKDACRAWLDSMPMSLALAPRFCPNADLLFELQFDQPGHIRGACNEPGLPPARSRRDET
jgi:hypothetical protein